MSRYTTELRWIVEQAVKNAGLAVVEANWSAAYDAVGLADYPIFDERYRPTLNDKIIRRYYTREIGAETAGRFRMFVRDAMYLIMPYYNQLYESELAAKGIDPLNEYAETKTEHATGTTDASGTEHADRSDVSTTSDNRQNVYQDTPQSELIADQIRNLKYATNVTLDDLDSKTTEQGAENSTNASRSHYDNAVNSEKKGHGRSQSELIKIYRSTFLNIDKDVVEDIELRECFMTIW